MSKPLNPGSSAWHDELWEVVNRAIEELTLSGPWARHGSACTSVSDGPDDYLVIVNVVKYPK